MKSWILTKRIQLFTYHYTIRERKLCMNQKVEGLYPNVHKALRAVDLLRGQGYSRDEITLVANEDVRRKFGPNVDSKVNVQDYDEEAAEDDSSFWDSIKDAFTFDETYDNANYDDPNYDSTNDPVYEHREAIQAGHIAVLIKDETDDVPSMEPDTQPNTVGPEGTRDYEEEQEVESKGEHPRTDRELTQDELRDYEKKQ